MLNSIDHTEIYAHLYYLVYKAFVIEIKSGLFLSMEVLCSILRDIFAMINFLKS